MHIFTLLLLLTIPKMHVCNYNESKKVTISNASNSYVAIIM